MTGSNSEAKARAEELAGGAGLLAVLLLRANDGTATDLYSDLTIADLSLSDSPGVIDLRQKDTLAITNGQVVVSGQQNIDNAHNGLPDCPEKPHNMDLLASNAGLRPRWAHVDAEACLFTLGAMKQVFLVAAGGGLGAVLRWWIAGWFFAAERHGFPLGIFVVNVTGCFTFGLLHGFCHARGGDWSLALLTGLLGGYTTFSSFGWDTYSLFRADRPFMAAGNAVLSVLAGVLAVWAGAALSDRVAR